MGLVPTPIYDTDMSLYSSTACRREVGEVVHPRSVDEESPWKKFGQMMIHKAVHLLALFLMVYIGVEVTIGGIICSLLHHCFNRSWMTQSGWTASFLMLIRGGGPSSGYVSTGFFGGKHLVTPLCVEYIFYLFLIRSYIGSYYLIPDYG